MIKYSAIIEIDVNYTTHSLFVLLYKGCTMYMVIGYDLNSFSVSFLKLIIPHTMETDR